MPHWAEVVDPNALPGVAGTNAQTGTTYTYRPGDRALLVSHSNAGAIAGTLPRATGSFGRGWYMWVSNTGAGTLTITPTTSTIDGAATLALATGAGALIVSDGANSLTMRGGGGGGGGGGGVTSVTGTAGRISSTGGATPVLDLISTGVSAGSYAAPTITVDSFGRITAIVAGAAFVVSCVLGINPEVQVSVQATGFVANAWALTNYV